MATDLKTRKSPQKFDDFLKRKFAELCARLERVDLAAHALSIVLVIVGYAFLYAIFDWSVAGSTATEIAAIRWFVYGAFLLLVVALAVKTARCYFRRVNPYFVAHQLEETLPDAKNGLINWLDLRDEELPSAFRKNLGARAAEQWREGDADQIVTKRKVWVLAGILAVPLLGLMTMFVLDPAGLVGSMRRAFLPFYAPVPTSRITITLLQPEGGDIDVIPTQSVTFVAKIEGRLPAANRPGAPTLHWRYQDNDDFFTLPLQQEDTKWAATLDASKLRSGFTYKLTAGDAETQEYRVTVRPRAHVRKFEITYRHRPFRKLSDSTSVFPSANAAAPRIHGPAGTEVEMRIHTSRAVKSARIDFIVNKTRAGSVSDGKPGTTVANASGSVELFKDKTPGFVCKFTLTQPGQFRVVYTAFDGEENADRALYPIDVMPDELPRVVLTRPGKDMDIPYNSSFILEGNATSVYGVRGLNLRLRVAEGAGKGLSLAPIVYRPGTSFQHDNGTYTLEADYMEFVALNQLKDDKGNLTLLTPGDIVEYWLEATDGADFPNPLGNVGKSPVYKLKLLSAPVDPKQESIFRKQAEQRIKQHQQKQDEKHANDNKSESGGGNGGNGAGASNPQGTLDKIKQENAGTQKKLDNAQGALQPDRGETKSSDPKPGESKSGQGSADAPDPMSKQPPPMSSNEAGDRKDQSGAASGDSRGTGTPMPKQGPNAEPPRMGDAKGNEQNGPERPTNDQQNAKNGAPPPNLSPKAGGMNEPAAPPSTSKGGPGDATKEPSQARGDGQKSDAKEPSFDRLDKDLQKLQKDGPEGDAAAKDLADIAKNANDARKRELAKEILQKNGRDPKNGEKVKTPHGTGGKSPGISDRIKADAANREFAARIGQMQLDDWQKRLTPELLKKAGISDAEWQRFVQNTQDYNARVRALNAQIARQAMKQLDGPRNLSAPTLIEVERNGASAGSPEATPPSPPELRGSAERFYQLQKK